MKPFFRSGWSAHRTRIILPPRTDGCHESEKAARRKRTDDVDVPVGRLRAHDLPGPRCPAAGLPAWPGGDVAQGAVRAVAKNADEGHV